MKSVVIHRIALFMSLLLLAAGVVSYLYMRGYRLSDPHAESLYSMVPADAIAVVETDDVASFVDEVTGGDGSVPNVSLPVSDMVKCLKEYVGEFVESSPHGLSVQISRVLLSYHKPESPVSQVLYCHVDADDATRLQEHFTHYFQHPEDEPQVISYKGESIAIYPMADGHELSAYVSDNQLALSFSSELLQQVIEAQQQNGTLSSNAAFMNLQNTKSAFVRTAVYQQTNNRWELVF